MWLFGIKTRCYIAVSRQIGLTCDPDTWMIPDEQYWDMLCFSSVVFFYVGGLSQDRFLSVRTLNLCETQEWLSGLEYVSI